jgi:hypothetical protein
LPEKSTNINKGHNTLAEQQEKLSQYLSQQPDIQLIADLYQPIKKQKNKIKCGD